MDNKKLARAQIMRLLGIILIIIGLIGFSTIVKQERKAEIQKMLDEHQAKIDALDDAFGGSDND